MWQDMPAKYVYEPWKAPRKVQEEARCIVGEDYPAPIVDHQIVHKVNIQRIKAAYDANAKGSGGTAAGGSSGSKRPASGGINAKKQRTA
jgi:cryptochrome